MSLLYLLCSDCITTILVGRRQARAVGGPPFGPCSWPCDDHSWPDDQVQRVHLTKHGEEKEHEKKHHTNSMKQHENTSKMKTPRFAIPLLPPYCNTYNNTNTTRFSIPKKEPFLLSTKARYVPHSIAPDSLAPHNTDEGPSHSFP
jgi:hypothetical protein